MGRANTIPIPTPTAIATATAGAAHSADTDIARLVHAQHTSLLVRTHHLTFITPHFPANAYASTVTWIKHVHLSTTHEHRKQLTRCCCCRPASDIGKTERGKLSPVTDVSTGQNSAEARVATRGTSVLSALLDYQASAGTSL